jgi:penicillin-binding protein 1C
LFLKKEGAVFWSAFLTGAALWTLMTFRFAAALPDPLFRDPYSWVITDQEGGLLGAAAAEDGQWRFPRDNLSAGPGEKFIAALTVYEDRRFFSHNGIDLPAIARAARDNLRRGQIVSGASTLPMQVIRLFRKNPRRTVGEKIKEMILAQYLTLREDKPGILELFADHAPFGGNVVGLEAAAWRYLGRSPEDLTWGEAALLAALPNSPGLIHPGRNREELRQKRDRLLNRLAAHGRLSPQELTLALGEPVPSEPLPLPQRAPHLLERFRSGNLGAGKSPGSPESGGIIRTTLRGDLQDQVNAAALRYGRGLLNQNIGNLGILVMETLTGRVLAYVGNIPEKAGPESYVDMVTAPRSTGSLLKPFLWTAMINAGELLPRQLVLDIPTRMGTYRPENAARFYQGAVPAEEALVQSLNVPAARMLRDFGVDRFYGFLKDLGMSTLTRPASDYGISLILGGAEGTLENLTALYAGLARLVLTAGGEGEPGPLAPRYLGETAPGGPPAALRTGGGGASGKGGESFLPGAAYLCLRALERVARPPDEQGWQDFLSSRPVSWKTGTSQGSRDGWTIGTTPGWTLGVWVGNADGAGNPAIQGSRTAAPLFFQVMALLQDREVFPQPPGMVSLEVCRKSGFLAGPDCPETETILYPGVSHPGIRCPYHRLVRLNPEETRQTHAGQGAVRPWFVLPPAAEWYYSRWNLDYRPLPPFEGEADPGSPPMEVAFPENGAEIYIPIEVDGRAGAAVFEVYHREAGRRLFWHLDENYLGSTREIHQMSLRPGRGDHLLTIIDDQGNVVRRSFSVLSG